MDKILNTTFKKLFLQSYNCLELRNFNTRVKIMELSTTWQPPDICIQLNILQTKWKHYTEQE